MKQTILFLLMLIALPLSAQDMSVFEKRVYTVNSQSLPYRIMFPKDYNPNKKYPLVIFLHGAGERGTDNEKHLKNGGQWLVDNLQSDYPAIVIAPQCPEIGYWVNAKREVLPKGSPMKFKFTFYKDSAANTSMKLLMALTKEWINSGKINKKQVYVGGLSMGGMGTYELLIRMPKTFAAAFIMCGAVDLDWFTAHDKKTPLWLFHGAIDQVVPVNYARDAFKLLNDGKREIKYTEYPGVYHNSWDNTFKEPGVFSWLFSHKK